MSVGRFLQQGAAGNASGGVYVDDVFSTYLYDGTGTSFSGPGQTITNGIDLAGEGGMVWLKARNSAQHNLVIDTVRGGENRLITNSADAAGTDTGYHISNFNSDGFSLQANGTGSNNSSYNYVSWTFRKQPGFFDVVTYTGTGSAQAISHNLGTTPGMVIVKNLTDNATNWIVYHRGSNGGTNPEQYSLLLNSTSAQAAISGDWNNTAPTSTQFTVGNQNRTNGSGDSFVAYLFAHDAQDFGTDSDESIIKCGSYTGNGSTTGPVIDLGFEPQWVMIKSTGTNPWMLFDSMRGIVTNNTDRYLMANDASAENGFQFLNLTPTGFQLNSTGSYVNTSSQDYIYVAIRRPHKPAEEFAATDLFTPQTTFTTLTTGLARYQPGHLVDMVIAKATGGGSYGETSSRLTQGKYLNPDQTFAETSDAWYAFDYNDGFGENGAGSAYTTNSVHYMFRRAPGFFDVATYTGTGSTQNISHNLNAVPEMLAVKRRDSAASWNVYHSATGETRRIFFNLAGQAAVNSGAWNNTAPTADIFTVGSNSEVNVSGGRFVAYLFATVPGISKVGSYSGTGSNLTIDCGFSSGARFVLIKSTTFAGGWYLWDSARGITTGNDYHLKLNDTSAQITDGVVDIEPDSSGFILNGPNANINSSGNDYIFLAIA